MPLILGMLKRVTNSNDAPEGDLSKASLNGVAEENSVPPVLESFVPEKCLPDVIDVDVDYTGSYGMHNYQDLWKRVTTRHAIRFVRQYPLSTLTNEVNGSKPGLNGSKRKVLTGQLALRCSSFLGKGHHSKVILAPLTIPSTPPVRRAVAVKVPLPYCDSSSDSKSRQMLLNEAKIYNAFPRKLQDGDAPVVPKFYGYYVPSIEAFDICNNGRSDDLDEKQWETVRMMLDYISPFLLLEACGKEVCSRSLSHTDKTAIGKLLERLHNANFVQGSMFPRNILVQPGPLELPRANRSLDYPSYRIVDFGRGKGFGVDSSSLEGIYYEAKEERGYARQKELVP